MIGSALRMVIASVRAAHGPYAVIICLLFGGCVSRQPQKHVVDLKTIAQQMSLAVENYLLEHKDLDHVLMSKLSLISMGNLSVASDGKTFAFSEWRYEPELNRLFHPGYKVGRETTRFIVTFKKKRSVLIVSEARMIRYWE